MRRTYAERDRSDPPEDWRANPYHPRHALGRLFAAHNRDVLVDALNACEIELEHLRVLDVGCGTGHWLRLLVELGADPENLTGIDISADRIAFAQRKNPAITWLVGDGETLPFAAERFDLLMQTVVFSSIPSEGLRRKLAGEMCRVLKPGGGEKLATFSRAEVGRCFPMTEPIYKRAVHPHYFRRHYRHPWLATSLYRFTRMGCESWLLLCRKQ
jgi:ubiquinone/menaquinone biosynthesis C-methylase UbiE